MTSYRSWLRAHSPGSERGAAAVEFAFVAFPLFLILYGTIAFGMMLALKQSVTNAASEGARSAVGVVDNPATPLVDERVEAAKATVAQRLSWLGSKYNASDVTVPTPGPCPPPVDATHVCITVTYSYPYASRPLVPTGFSIGTPTSIVSQATVQIS